jgi:hypothetical protein
VDIFVSGCVRPGRTRGYGPVVGVSIMSRGISSSPKTYSIPPGMETEYAQVKPILY